MSCVVYTVVVCASVWITAQQSVRPPGLKIDLWYLSMISSLLALLRSPSPRTHNANREQGRATDASKDTLSRETSRGLSFL